jgi:nitrogen-specific signal transduction histidine kinase
MIEITDEGHGIPPEDISRIFDPYFTTKTTGTGLGLPTAFSIVRRHGGHIAVESRPGAGSTFRIYLPAQPGVKAAEYEPIAMPGFVCAVSKPFHSRDLIAAVRTATQSP